MEDLELTIDELARKAGSTTRSVRLYRERGLLHPPVRLGRRARYTAKHLARLRCIVDMLDRGYSLSAIGEVFTVWQQGGDIGDLVGLHRAVSEPWSDEETVWVSVADLAKLYAVDQVEPSHLQRTVALGLVIPDGAGFRVPSMRLLEAGAELVAAGVDLDAVLDQAEALQADLERIANRYLDLGMRYVFEPFLEAGMPDEDLPRVRELVDRLRPLATDTVHAALARVLDQAVADRIDRVMTSHFADVTAPSSSS